MIRTLPEHGTPPRAPAGDDIIDNEGTPVAKPEFDYTDGGTFPKVFSDGESFLAVVQVFEDTGVRAYEGQAGFSVGAGALLTAALQIHSVEGRRAAEIRRLRAQKVWITGAQGSDGVPAADATYRGGDNVMTFRLDASRAAASGGVTPTR